MTLSQPEQRLLHAATWHDCATIRELVACGVDVNVRGVGGNSALISLIQQPPAPPQAGEDATIAQLAGLVQFFKDPTYVSTAQEIETMGLLRDHGVRLDLTDAAGSTALACAVYGDNRPAVDFLLAAGADYLDFGAGIQSPFDYAVCHDRLELLTLFLERARREGRLTAIDADPRHGRWMDEATGETARMLEAAFGRSGKQAREKVRVLENAREQDQQAPDPVTFYLNQRGEAVFSSGAIPKLCPRCGYAFHHFFNYHGGRYGCVGDYQCPRCLQWYILHDDDTIPSPIHYIVHDDTKGYQRLLSLDYTRLYRIDVLPQILKRLSSDLQGELQGRDDCRSMTLHDILTRLGAALPAPDVIDRIRLEGGHRPPPDVAAWLAWLETPPTLAPGGAP